MMRPSFACLLSLSLPAALMLQGCAHRAPEAKVVTLPVNIPIAVKCISQPPEPVLYPDTDDALLHAPNAATRYKMLYAGRKIRVARISELEAMIGGCE